MKNNTRINLASNIALKMLGFAIAVVVTFVILVGVSFLMGY